jgi:hypothetical protein
MVWLYAEREEHNKRATWREQPRRQRRFAPNKQRLSFSKDNNSKQATNIKQQKQSESDFKNPMKLVASFLRCSIYFSIMPYYYYGIIVI